MVKDPGSCLFERILNLIIEMERVHFKQNKINAFAEMNAEQLINILVRHHFYVNDVPDLYAS
jgi:hypothetical protein